MFEPDLFGEVDADHPLRLAGDGQERPAWERPLVVAWGMGVNSTALLIGLAKCGTLPDLILAADTGGEKPATYRYLPVLDAWLAEHGFPERPNEWVRPPGYDRPEYGLPERLPLRCIVVVRNDGIHGTLEQNCLTNKTLPSKAYGYGACAEKYKARPQNKYLKSWPPAVKRWEAGEKVWRAVGYDAGEPGRATVHEDERFLYWHPLIEWGWTREDCVREIERAGLPIPPKSACYFCPSSTKKEIVQLHDEDPHLFGRAVAIERNAAANSTSVKGLGRRFAWEGLVSLPLFEQAKVCDPDDGPCMCWDGATDDN